MTNAVQDIDSTCWQYRIRQKNRADDIFYSGLDEEEIKNLTIDDFDFRVLESSLDRESATEFIKTHEWLGTLSQFTTHWFGAFYKGNMAGVVLMNVPNTFSKVLGEDTHKIERLISRGACISWSPKNLGSKLIMWSIRWMSQNTPYRLFIAYSDPEAKEIGTIYQACNFYYLGQGHGTKDRYINPYSGKMVSDRFFRQKTSYKKYAQELGIPWNKEWSHKTGMSWEKIPEDIVKILRAESKKKVLSCKKIATKQKHKYAYILGKDAKETRLLRKKFLEMNKTFPYPSPEKRGT